MSKLKSYSRNLLKSFGFTTSDLVNTNLSNVKDTFEYVGNTSNDISKFVRNQRNSLQRLDSTFSRDTLFNKSKDIMKSVKDDIMSGKFYDKYRDSDDDFNWDDLDDFNSDDDLMSDDVSDKRKTSNENIRSKILSKENKMNTQFLSNTLLSTTETMIESNKHNLNLMYSQNIALHSTLNKNLSNINNALSARIDNTNSLIKAQIDNSAKYYAESLNIQKQNNELLSKLVASGSNSNTDTKGKTGMDKVLSFGMIDNKKYWNQIKNNFNTNVFDTSDLMMAVDLFKMMKNEGLLSGGARTIADPLKFVPKMMMQGLLDKKSKDMISDFNDTFQDIGRVFLRKMNKLKGSSNGVLSLIGDILGVDNSISDAPDRSYYKGKVHWDGKSKKALEEVIPQYLSEITAALTNKENMVYDYESGDFIKITDLQKRKKNTESYYARNAQGDLAKNIDKLIEKLDASEDIKKDTRAKFDKLYSNLIRNDIILDKNSIKYATDLGLDDEHMLQLVEKALSKTNKGTKSNLASIKRRGVFEANKSRLNSAIKDSSSAENVLYSTMFKDNPLIAEGSKKLSGYGILGGVDEHNKTMFDYLREISFNTSKAKAANNLYSKGRTTSVKRGVGRRTTPYRGGVKSGVIPSQLDGEAVSSSLTSEMIDALDADDILDEMEYGTEKENWLAAKISKQLNVPVLNDVVQSAGLFTSKVLQTVLVGDEDSSNVSFIGALKNIFDNPDSVMGKFIREVEDSKHSSNMALNAIHLILDKIKATELYQKVSTVGKDVFSDIKSYGRSFGTTVKDAFVGIKDDVSSLFSGGLRGARDSYNDRLKAEKRFVDEVKTGNIRGFAGGTGKTLDRDAIVAVSRGEMILTPSEAELFMALLRDKNISRVNIAKGEVNSNIIDELVDSFNKKNKSTTFKEEAKKSGNFAKDVLDETINGADQVFQSLFNGKIKGSSDEVISFGKSIQKDVHGKLSKLLAGGAIGAGASLLLGTIGGPLVGAAAGIGVSLVKESDTFRKFMFGNAVTGEKGLIPGSVMHSLNKYIPDIKKYGIAGTVLGMLPVTPFGPVGGLMIGSAISFAKNNQGVQEALFGVEGVFGSEAYKFLEKNHKKLIAGAAIGVLTGPFGLIGNALLGSGIGALTASNSFTEGLLGTKINGRYENGILPMLRDNVVLPLKDFAMAGPKKLAEFIKSEIVKPLKSAFDPLKEAFNNLGRSINRTFKNMMSSIFEKAVATPLYKSIQDKLVDPIANRVKKMFNFTTNIVKGIVTAPFKAIGGLGNRLRDKQIKGGNAAYMTAKERLAYAGMRGLNVDQDLVNMDTKLAGMDIGQLHELKYQMATVTAVNSGKSNAYKNMSKTAYDQLIKLSNNKLKAQDTIKIGKAIDKNMSPDRLKNLTLSIAYKRKLTDEETNAVVKFVLKHQKDIGQVKNDDGTYKNTLNATMAKQLGLSEDWVNKYHPGDLMRRIDKEYRSSIKFDEEGNVHQVSPADRGMAAIERVANDTPKYRSDIKDKLSKIVDWVDYRMTGRVPDRYRTRISEKRNDYFDNDFYTSGENVRLSMAHNDQMDKRIDKMMSGRNVPDYIKNKANKKLDKLNTNLLRFGLISSPILFGGNKSDSDGDIMNASLDPTQNIDEEAASYENTQDGMIKYITNSHGAKEIDVSDSVTATTLAKKKKREKEESKARNAQMGPIASGKSEDSKDEKKNGILSKLLGLPGMIGNKLGGLLGGGKAGGFLGGMAGKLGLGLLGGPFAIMGLLAAAPYLNKTVVPYVQKNFDSKILPFVTKQVVPGTVTLITSLVPYIIKLGVEGVKAALGTLLNNGFGFLNGTNELVGNGLVTASGGELDQAMTIDENGNVVPIQGDGAHSSGVGTDVVQAGTRNLLTGGQLARNSRKAGIYTSAVGRKLGLDRLAGSKFGKWVGNRKIVKAGKYTTTAFRGLANAPNALLKGKPGQRLNVLKEATKSTRASHRTSGLHKFGDILKDEKRASELATKAIADGTGAGSILDTVKNKIYKVLEKVINLPFIKSRLGAEMVENLSKGGIGAITEKLTKDIAVRGILKNSAKSGAKAVGRTLAGVSTMGIATIAFAAYDIYDGWTHAYKYFGLTEEEQDEIPTGMKFISAIIVALKNLFIGTAIIPAEVFVNLYKSLVCKMFGEESMFKIKELEKKANKRVAEYNKKHKTNYTKAEFNKKMSDEKFAKTWYGKAWNAIVKPFREFFGGGKALTGKEKAIDVKNRYSLGLGLGPDNYSGSVPSKIVPKTTGTSHYYSQSDPKWGGQRLGNSDMSKAGCGPTSIAMALSNATGKNITPDKIARDNKENLPGYSTWGLFPSVAQKYGLGMNRVNPNAQDLVENLKHGEVILSGVRQTSDTSRTPFTNAGHIVVAKGIKNGKVEIADPRGGKYNKSYDMQDVLNETTIGFRYDTQGSNLDAVGSRFGNAGGADDKLGDKVVAFAKRIKDKVKYVYGANTFSDNNITTDCSGFTKFVYKQAAGIDLPRTSGEQGAKGRGISLSEAKAGDLAAYSGHVGIIINDKGDVIHNSAPGVNVIYGKAKTAGKGLNVRRILPDDQLGAGAAVSSDTTASSTDATSGASSAISPTPSGGDPLSTIFGGIGNAFMKAGADLFGIKMDTESTSSTSTSGDGGTSDESSSGYTPTADGSGQGLHKRIDRKEDFPASVYEAYLRKMGADPAFTGAAVKEAAEKSGLAGSDIMVWAALEANWGKSRIRRAYNNWFGIGAYDSNPDNANKYKHPTPAAGLVAGAKWIAKNYVYHPKYKQNTFNKVFNDTPPNHDYSTDNQEAAKLAGMRDKFLKFAAGYNAGKGPEESFRRAYGYNPSNGELNGLINILEGNAGGAPEEGSGSKSGNPAQLHGFPYYSQCDKEFNKPGFNMTWTGCGPTSAAMVATAATKRRVTPLETGAAAKAKGLWNGNNASSHDIFPVLGQKFGYTAKLNSSNKEFFDNASKRIVQFAVGTGRSPYTSGGHYIVVLGEKDGQLVTNNPISTKTSGAFPKSVYGVTRKSWAVSVGGKPLIWDGQGYSISGANPSAPSMDEGGSEEVPADHQQTGADPTGALFGGIGNAFLKAGSDLFGLNSPSSSDTTTSDTAESAESTDNAGTGLDRFFSKTLGAKKSSPFGRRKVAGFGDYHSGVDYDTNGKRKTLFSPIAGKVTGKSNTSGRGKSLAITDMYGNTHHFDHLTYAGVGVGDYIGEQDILGKIGDSGNAMGKHLHYEVTDRNNESVDPHDYMRKYGAFGGVENQKIGKVTDQTFSSYDTTVRQPSTSSDSKFTGRMFVEFMGKIINLLVNIASSNKLSSDTLTAIIAILNKYSDKLPPEAKQELSAIDSINDVLAHMANADKYAMAKQRNRESKLINSDIREVTDIMKRLSYE